MLQKEYWKTKPGESMDRRKFLKELRDIKKENFEQNLKFMDLYSKFLKSKTNSNNWYFYSFSYVLLFTVDSRSRPYGGPFAVESPS